jgi:hypothetical protein
MPHQKSKAPNGSTIANGTDTLNKLETSNLRIPTYLPLDQAAQKLGLSQKVLTQQIQAGKIAAVQLPSGELLVAADNNGQKTNGQAYQTKDEIIAAHFAHLRGQTINAYQSQQKYGIHHQNFQSLSWGVCPQEKLPCYLAFFEFIHNVRRRGKALLHSLLAALLAP